MSLQPSGVVDTHTDIRGSSDSDRLDLPCGNRRGAPTSATALSARSTQQPSGALLTVRECRVLLEISRGASNKQVAQLLSISPSTVRTHVESVFRKLQCSTRAAATVKALSLGFIADAGRVHGSGGGNESRHITDGGFEDCPDFKDKA